MIDVLGSDSSTYGVRVAGFTSSGAGLNQLSSPSSMVLQTNGDMYIVDQGNYRVMKYASGQSTGTIVAGGSCSGTTLDKLIVSYGIALDSLFNIYVSEYSNHRVSKWASTTTGAFVCLFFLSL